MTPPPAPAAPDASPPVDPYARHAQWVREPPAGLAQTLRFVGPGVILVGSVVGSGEIMMTTNLGALVGFTMLWWMLLSCWGKSIVQAELARHTVSSGETTLHAFNRLPGKIPGPARPVSWFIWLWLLTLIPGHLGGGGIYGGVGQSVNAMFPLYGSEWWTVLFAALASLLVLTGTYQFLERLLLFMVVVFTGVTLACAVMLQFTPYAITWNDLRGGLRFEFPAFAVGAALAAYGGTGVAVGEVMAYPYWCAEKGYARFAGPTDPSRDWVRRAQGWIRVMQVDVLLTLGLLTLATIPFYMLGAGVLHGIGARPQGLATIQVLSNVYTQTMGPWAWWLFMVGAFFVLYSTVISGLGAGARMFADCMGVMGVIDPGDYRARLRVLRWWAVLSPLVASLCYYFVRNPIWMLVVGGTVSALMMPIVAGATLYLRYAHLDRRIAPTWKADLTLWACFLVMLVLGGCAVYQQFVN
jgi:Mn2+/Fe2+ NRAMP family transporter